MISGRQTLATIDSSIEELRGAIATTAQQIEERNSRLLALQQESLQKYQELSRLRVELYRGDGQGAGGSDIGKTVRNLLARRRDEQQKISDELAALRLRRDSLDGQRQELAEKVDAAAKVVDTAEKKTQDRLQLDPAYQEQLKQTRETERMLKHATSKAEQWQEELAQKGKPYQDDPLFMYLWNRRFATVEYQASGLSRWLDTKVAKIINYPVARVNYSKLQEIPRRLREHAEDVEQEAGRQFEALKMLDTKAREEDGIPALEATLDQEEARLAAIDEQIAGALDEQQQLEQQQAAYHAGQDRLFHQAVEFVTSELQRDDLQKLRYQAYATPFPEDDLVVSQLLDLEAQEQDVQHSISELTQMNRQQQNRLLDMESLRTKFKRNRLDGAGVGFSDPAVIVSMLGNLVNGVMSSRAFWELLEQQRRMRRRQADPGFGSGGFGRGTIWGSGMRFPGSGGGLSFPGGGVFGGGINFPGGGGHTSGGGGGFRTGGGF